MALAATLFPLAILALNPIVASAQQPLKVIASTTSSASSAASVTQTSLSSPTANFPPVGSISRDYSDAGLEQLWDIVGSVEPPPFTTTRVPDLPIPTPSSPPALYPSWFAPTPSDILPSLPLPKGFKFGVATAAYQVEGAVKNDGKGPTMWDWNSRQPNGVVDNTTGDIVDLQYYLYKEDVARVAALGINAHSFSISWARIFPFGTADSPVNQAGLDHYSDLIDYHIQMGVEPDYRGEEEAQMGLVHWDTPLSIQAYYGGFLSSNVVDDFVKEMGIQGEIAFKNDDFVGIPWRANNSEDIAAVERHAAFRIGAFSNPAYTTGDWPEIMTDTLPPSYLPRFTAEEKQANLDTADFFATDAYRTQYVMAPEDGLDACIHNSSHPLWPECHTVVLYDTNGWAAGPNPDPLTSWLQATPNFVRGSLKDLQERWPTKKMYVSEFGFTEPFEAQWTELYQITEDTMRTSNVDVYFLTVTDLILLCYTDYFMTYLGEILLAIHEDNLPIAGTFAWACELYHLGKDL
ncbi:hypothetical protein H0H92_013199 [Tricholoma furcatifolium]|nr:hypothetical protein H0H92_013199 [Tricholoma furcatifolium]